MAADDPDEWVDPEPFIKQRGVRSAPRYAPTKTSLTPRQLAHKQLKRPATLLLLMAIVGIMIGLFLILVNYFTYDRTRPGNYTMMVIGGVIILWYFLIAYGAFEMDRLGSYRMAKFAAWMAVIPLPLPTYFFTLFTSIFVLSALSKPDVQREFRTGNT